MGNTEGIICDFSIWIIKYYLKIQLLTLGNDHGSYYTILIKNTRYNTTKV